MDDGEGTRMKTNTSDLTGTALDWAVAYISGALSRPLDLPGSFLNGVTPHWSHVLPYYKPSTDWSLGGPIIDRERISVLPFDGRWEARCAASITRTPARFIERRGPTPLVAAMRCYVASKLGDTVDVPDELMGCL
jgi:hypothetical protein